MAPLQNLHNVLTGMMRSVPKRSRALWGGKALDPYAGSATAEWNKGGLPVVHAFRIRTGTGSGDQERGGRSLLFTRMNSGKGVMSESTNWNPADGIWVRGDSCMQGISPEDEARAGAALWQMSRVASTGPLSGSHDKTINGGTAAVSDSVTRRMTASHLMSR